MGEFLRRRKQDQIEPVEVRDHVVKVRFNDRELSILDIARGHLSRAEVLRFLLLNKMPPAVPELNREAWIQLSRAASNLNQISLRLNSGEAVQADLISAELMSFRSSLIGVQ